MNIHYGVTGLLTAMWTVTVILSGLSELAREKGGRVLIAHMRDIKESVGSSQLDN